MNTKIIFDFLNFLFLNKDVWVNVWANFLAIGIGYFVIVVFKRKKMLSFFGFDKQKKLSILLSTLYIPTHTAITHSGSKISYQGLAIPEYEHQVIPFFSELFSIITTGDGVMKTVINKLLLGDVDISYLNTPMNINKISFQNFICIGGPSANVITEHYMNTGMTWLGFNKINTGIDLIKGQGKGKTLGVSNSQDDYGILEKIIDKKNNSSVFIAAGGNFGATKAAAYYLARNWRALQKEFGNNGFALCIKVPQHFVDPDGYLHPQVIYKRRTN
jgi:hypothetical protein